MPKCVKCNEVVGAMDIAKDGVCKNCMPDYDPIKDEHLTVQKQDPKEEVALKDDIYGIITFALSLLGFLGMAIITAPIALFLGYVYSKGSILAKIGIVLAWIQIVLALLYLFGAIGAVSYTATH